jgi:hypothetical protein
VLLIVVVVVVVVIVTPLVAPPTGAEAKGPLLLVMLLYQLAVQELAVVMEFGAVAITVAMRVILLRLFHPHDPSHLPCQWVRFLEVVIVAVVVLMLIVVIAVVVLAVVGLMKQVLTADGLTSPTGVDLTLNPYIIDNIVRFYIEIDCTCPCN